MLTSVPGFKVGHYTDTKNLTGCTVVLCPDKTRASCEVRGNSPGSRELALLAPEKSMQEIHAVVLTGGSAFGLASADGVMNWLQERNIGYETPWVRVPIVPAAVVFDLNVGASTVRPTAAAGYAACQSATTGQFGEGSVGAGTGTTVGKWAGMDHWMKGGIGSDSRRLENVTIGVLAVVNAVGDILDEGGRILAGAREPGGKFLAEKNPVRTFARGKVLERGNTTLVVMATNAAFSKIELLKICQRMNDGMARAIVPCHTSYDGDACFALSSGQLNADLEQVAEAAADLTGSAIRRAIRAASSLGGIPALIQG